MTDGRCWQIRLAARLMQVGDTRRVRKQVLPEGLTMIHDLPYGLDDTEAHRLDLYFPEDANVPLPVILDIHGGGFFYGSKELNEAYCCQLASSGCFVVNMNYRLIPEVSIRDQVQDVFAALHFLERLNSSFPMGLNEMFLAGDSAGGALAIICDLIQKSPKLQKIYAVDPFSRPIHGLGLSCPTPFIRDGYIRNDSLMKYVGREIVRSAGSDCCWMKHMSLEELCDDAILDPVFLVSTPEDQQFYKQSKRLNDLLVEKRIQHVFLVKSSEKERLGHIFNVRMPEKEVSKKVNQSMLDFFCQILREEQQGRIREQQGELWNSSEALGGMKRAWK